MKNSFLAVFAAAAVMFLSAECDHPTGNAYVEVSIESADHLGKMLLDTVLRVMYIFSTDGEKFVRDSTKCDADESSKLVSGLLTFTFQEKLAANKTWNFQVYTVSPRGEIRYFGHTSLFIKPQKENSEQVFSHAWVTMQPRPNLMLILPCSLGK